MQVILKENIDNLGTIGDVVQVSAGYARNFLLPQGLVVQANENQVAQIEHHKRLLEKKRLAQKTKADELAAKLKDLSCTLTRKVGKGDKLFGSVGVNDIAVELENAGFPIQKSQIQLEENIKTLGVHPVTIRLQPDVTAEIKVWVVKEEG